VIPVVAGPRGSSGVSLLLRPSLIKDGCRRPPARRADRPNRPRRSWPDRPRPVSQRPRTSRGRALQSVSSAGCSGSTPTTTWSAAKLGLGAEKRRGDRHRPSRRASSWATTPGRRWSAAACPSPPGWAWRWAVRRRRSPAGRMGDLIATCMSPLSRNRTLGEAARRGQDAGRDPRRDQDRGPRASAKPPSQVHELAGTSRCGKLPFPSQYFSLVP